MKKFFALIFSLLCVGMIFVGCSKEGDQYFYDVYDLWKEKIDATENEQYYNKDVNITFDEENIDGLILKGFGELNQYRTTFNNMKSDIELLSREFIHDPELEGKALKNAQNKVTAYKEGLNDYAEEIDDFKNAKRSFEEACANLDFEVAGIIEDDAYKTFLAEFVSLINALNEVFSKMYDCAEAMFYSGQTSEFVSNDERVRAIKENYLGTKVELTKDYVFFCHANVDESQSVTDRRAIYLNYINVQQLELTSEDLSKNQSASVLTIIDEKIEVLHTWLNYYKAQSAAIKQAMERGEFSYSVDELQVDSLEDAIKKQNYEKFSDLINSTMKNLSETCASLVAFY